MPPARRRVVERETEVGPEAAAIEGLRSAQGALLRGREEELDLDRCLVPDESPGGAEHGCDSGLVVGAQDRLVAIGENSVLAEDVYRTVERDRVDVRAEEDRPGTLRPRYPREQVARAGARLLGGVVLLDLEA